MAVSPITSPKTQARTDGNLLGMGALNQSGNGVGLFGLGSNSKDTIYLTNFSATPMNQSNTPFSSIQGVMQQQNMFGSQNQAQGQGQGLPQSNLFGSQGLGTSSSLNQPSNPFSLGPSTNTNFFNPSANSMNPPQQTSSLFGNINPTGTFGQPLISTFSGMSNTGGLKFSVGKKDGGK